MAARRPWDRRRPARCGRYRKKGRTGRPRSPSVRAAVVNAGGDLRAIGPAVPIHLRDPADPSTVHFAGLLQHGTIATASPAATLTRFGADPVTALVRPRTRQPVVTCDACSVIAGSCVVADALTRVLAQLRRPDAPLLAASAPPVSSRSRAGPQPGWRAACGP
jgi:thiamine biosynthesis lipoprotein